MRGAERTDEDPALPLVAVCAATGECAAALLSKLARGTGAGFVVVSPDRRAIDVIEGRTPLVVKPAEDGVTPDADTVIVASTDRALAWNGGGLRLHEPRNEVERAHPLDFFLRSLAAQAGERVTLVVLSGLGSDGALGVSAVRGAGGLVLLQDPSLADHADLPRAALATGQVEATLDLDGIARTLHEQSERARTIEGRPSGDDLEALLDLLRRERGVDLHAYRRATLIRRIHRRMGLSRVATFPEYLSLVTRDAAELERLGRDLLVRVTSFFRDPDLWNDVRETCIGPLIADADERDPLRMWVAGCATGEEAYTLAILAIEEMERRSRRRPIQIFATDVDGRALDVARSGQYPATIELDVSPERLERFFEAHPGGYRVRKELRELVIFAPHNLIEDPPFSRLDLVSCRNLLIYLERDEQRRVLMLFHFALRVGGYLVLGGSETAGREPEAYHRVSERHPIYRHVSRPGPRLADIKLVREGRSVAQVAPPQVGGDVAAATQSLLLRRFAPAAVAIDETYRTLYFHGPTHRFVRQPQGSPTTNLLELVEVDLRAPLRTVVEGARKEGESSVITRLRGDSPLQIRVTAQQIGERGRADQRPLLVTFEEIVSRPPAGEGSGSASEEIIRQLEHELSRTREELQRTIEDLESSNEELTSSNEEVMSMNEELQSTNEELETSKEELQSLNEELITVNAQLEDKVGELQRTNDDLGNLLRSTDIGTLFLDSDLRIRRYTAACTRLLRLIPSDVGRPVTDLAARIDIAALERDARAVLDRLVPVEAEIMADDGSCYIRRVLPYRTRDERIEGVVVVFTDITALKRAEERRARQALEAELILRATSLVSESPSFEEALQGCLDIVCELVGWPVGHIYLPDDNGHRVTSSGIWHLDDPVRRRELVEKTAGTSFDPGEGLAGSVFLTGKPGWFEDVTKDDRFVRGRDVDLGIRAAFAMPIVVARRVVAVLEFFNDRAIAVDAHMIALVRSVGEQIGRAIERKVAHDALRSSEARLREQAKKLEEADRNKNDFLAMLGHELRNPLAPLYNAASLLNEPRDPDPERARAAEIILAQAHRMRRLVDDLLDVARITRGAIRLRTEPVDLRGPVRQAIDDLSDAVTRRRQELTSTFPDEPAWVRGDPVRLAQIASNLLTNAIQYTGEGGRIWVTVAVEGDRAVLRVRDSGVGIDPDRIPDVFQAFTQFGQTLDRASGGLGLGLTLVQSLVHHHGGTIEATSPGPGGGSEFIVRLPLGEAPTDEDVGRASPVPADSGPPARILVVDDNEDAAETLALILQRAGHDVVTAHTGREALETARVHRPEVVFLDIGLPDIDGYDVARRLREEPHSKDCMLVALTGYGQERDRALAHRAGFDRHLLKPVTTPMLHQVLRDRSRARTE